MTPEPAQTACDTGPESVVYELPDITTPLPIDQLFPDPCAPVEVDVGCGKGRFLLARASAFPGTNFLGIERQLVRVRKVDKKALRAGLTNVRLVRLEADYTIRRLIPRASISVFYVFFPDPWPKRRHHKRRLFVPSFLDVLHEKLVPGGLLHCATDHLPYFEEICTLFDGHPGFTEVPAFQPREEERTDFELIFLGQSAPIGRASYRRQATSESALDPTIPICN